MSTVCREHHDVEVRPGRRCRRCAGVDDPPSRDGRPAAPDGYTGGAVPTVLAEEVLREHRAAGRWPSSLPLPTDPTRPRSTRRTRGTDR